MSDTVPVWTQSLVLIANEVVDVGETIADHSANAEFDLTGKYGAWLFIAVAREDNTAVAAGIRINVRRNDGIRPNKNSPSSRFGGEVTAADTAVDATSAQSQNVLNVADTTGFAADDFIAIGDMTDGSRLEFHRVAKVTNPGAGGELVLDDNLENEHTLGQADVVTNQADLWEQWLSGGANYTIQADYGRAASGPDVVVRVTANRWDLNRTS